jgi:DNA-binding response OmpR family regulator
VRDDYVTKPFSLRELTARIRALFRRSEATVATGAPPQIVDLGRVQADLGGHRLLRDGDVLPIKPKAFELLAFLIRNPGQVFTRDQLLEKVWGYDYGVRRARSMCTCIGCAARSRRTRDSPRSSTPSAASATSSVGRPDARNTACSDADEQR